MEALEKTWQEVLSMEKDTYTLVDTRDELSFAYGNIPGSINLSEEALLAEADQWKDKTLVLYCKKGEHSLEVAGHLREAGWQEAYSLKGGYLGWLMQRMQTEDETSQPEITTFDIEQSLRKKFKKTIWSKLPRQSVSMNWCRRAIRSLSVFPAVRIPCSWQSCFRNCSAITR